MKILRWLIAAVALAIFAVAGFAVGLAGAFFHDVWPEVAGISLPVGIVVALGAEAVVLLLAGLAFRNRLAVVAPAAGWLLAILTMSAERSEGDLVVGATGTGYVLLLGGALVIGLCLAVPYGRAPRPSTGATAPPASDATLPRGGVVT